MDLTVVAGERKKRLAVWDRQRPARKCEKSEFTFVSERGVSRAGEEGRASIPVTGSNRPLQRLRQVDRATLSPAGEKCRPHPPDEQAPRLENKKEE